MLAFKRMNTTYTIYTTHRINKKITYRAGSWQPWTRRVVLSAKGLLSNSASTEEGMWIPDELETAQGI